MDKFDRKILTALHDNARISFAELGRKVNLSAPAIADRVNKMEQAGIITGYHAAISPEKTGCPILCLIELTVKHLEYYAVIDHLKAMPEVIECASITGSSGLMVKVAVVSMQALQTLITRLMQFGDTKTSIIIDQPIPLRLSPLPDDDQTPA